jgi:hypothetical protein
MSWVSRNDSLYLLTLTPSCLVLMLSKVLAIPSWVNAILGKMVGLRELVESLRLGSREELVAKDGSLVRAYLSLGLALILVTESTWTF